MKRKLGVLITAAVMLMSVFGVYAEEADERNKNGWICEIISVESPIELPMYSFGMYSQEEMLPIEEYLAEEFAKHTKTVDISSYNITMGELSVILSKHYEYMVVSGKLSVGLKTDSPDETNPIVTVVQPYYINSSASDDEAGRKFISDSVAAYADWAKGKTNDKLEQLLLVHDKIISDVTYDYDYATNSFSAYGLFKNKTAVCQGYAEAMYLIAGKLGIEAEFCSYSIKKSSQSFEGHIWNYVKLDGQWYQLDATWDDPDSTSSPTAARHKYFLTTDAVIEEGHYAKNTWLTSFDEKPNCDDAKYQSNYFFNIYQNCTLAYDNGEFTATLDIQEPYNSIVFSSHGGLYTGPIINSAVQETDDAYLIYQYFLKETDGYDILTAERDGKAVKNVNCYKKSTDSGYGQYTMSGVAIPKSDFSANGEFEVYMWDLDTQTPLANKIQFN